MTAPTESMDPRLVEANVEMLKAQARMFDKQAVDYAANIPVREAEARQKLARALAAEYAAEQMRVQTEATVRQEKLNLTSNHMWHEYQFSDPVYEDAVDCCLAQLAMWHRQDPECDMHIIIDSPGGSVISGMHLLDQISAYSKRPWDVSNKPKGTHTTTMTVRGYAASMAGILLQSADVRRIGPEAYLMIHEVSSFAQGKIGELKDEIKFLDRVSARVADLFVARSNGKITLQAFQTGWNRTDWWLDSEQALTLGFVDEIG